ncbi:MAG TPA: sensor histidine kinase, partial [Burkholderiales bacterium]|nr:sensor histidine kinase [Burkholderiales bacterium]
AQQKQLTEKVSQLTILLAQNEQLNERVTRAAGRTAALNERFLHRIAADLHDGAGQGLALALMRMETLAEACSACSARIAKDRTVREEFRTLREALRTSLEDLRSISKGLHLPEMEDLSISETARRAIRDYERSSAMHVTLTLENVPEDAPVAQKIALFRLLQESLANGFRHGGGVSQRVTLRGDERTLRVEVADDGKGFDPERAAADGHLGLQGMRERVEILGGTFDVRSADGRGTLIFAVLPLTAAEVEHG